MKAHARNTILLSVNTAWNVWNFRIGLIRAMQEAGYQVAVAAPADRHAERLIEAGCEFHDLPMDSNGTHPGRDALLLARYLRLLRRLAPAAFLGYTIKPNVYGGMAAHMLGIPVVNNIAGLGAAFIDDGFVTKVARLLYRRALGRSHKVFFQNRDDREMFISGGLVDAGRTALLPGSGIPLWRYAPRQPQDMRPGPELRFLMVGRMLINKGVVEYAEAARIVRRALPQARFALLGPAQDANPNRVEMARIRAWQEEGLIDYLGEADDVRPFLAEADCVVLPSYREGVPRTLLEGAAMARPLIATDVAGCREVVEHGVNGLLCRERDAGHLAQQMLALAALPRAARLAMGEAGRRKVEREFDEALVIRSYLEAIAALTRHAARPAVMAT
jgi:glycosyltransferase involved in cell wall biosynthesis